MSEHTKGPWKAIPGEDNENGVTSHIGIIADGWHIARVWGDGPNPEADARPSSAAPDLLEALKALVEFEVNGAGSGKQIITRAQAAIAKAEVLK